MQYDTPVWNNGKETLDIGSHMHIVKLNFVYFSRIFKQQLLC